METAGVCHRRTSPAVDEDGWNSGEDRSRASPTTRLRAGDQQVLAEIVDHDWNRCIVYAMGLLDRPDSGDVAEELVQEAFVRLWVHRNRWKPNTPPRLLLLRILRNLILNEARRVDVRRKFQQRVKAAESRSNPTPDDILDGKQVRDQVRQAVRALPSRRREIFLLVRQHGLTYSEVAETMGISRQTVANQMSAALQALRDALEPFL